MSRRISILVFIAFFSFTFSSAGHVSTGAYESSTIHTRESTATPPAGFTKLPIFFGRNDGQADPQFKYLSRGNGYDLYMGENEILLQGQETGSSRASLRMRFLNSSNVTLSAEDGLPGKSNYLVGHDRSQWRTSIPQFGKLRYRGVAPGVDAVFYGTVGKRSLVKREISW